MVKKPNKVNIMGTEYKILYEKKPSDVDIHQRESLWGQIDFWTRTIRVFDNDRPTQDLWKTIVHEILHGIEEELHLKCFEAEDKKRGHNELDMLASALVDTFVRNGWFEIEG